MFGRIVREHRRRMGLSQEELAQRAGISVRGLRDLEAGRIDRPRAATMRRLAEAFGLHGAERDRFCQAATGTAAPDTGEHPVVPAQLPADVWAFTGRAAELADLDALLAAPPQKSTAVLITAVAGTAGVGKTALAVHWAHRVKHRFPDGQLYVNLRGFDPRGAVMDPAEAIRRFLDALGVPAQRIPADPDAQAGLYRTLLAAKRMLVVLDNARDPDQVGPLLPGAPGCLVLVTSRHRLSGLVAAAGAHPIPLDLLTPDEARDLLARRLGADRITAEPEAVDAIVRSCARLPLALAIVAANTVTQPGLPLAAVATDLHDAHDRLGVLSTGDAPGTDVRAVFSWSYQHLAPAAARLFRLLGLHPGPDISAAAAASLAGLPPPAVRPLLAELARAHLVVEHQPGRYTFHDLLRAYATELAHTADSDTDRQAAIHRTLDHYLHSAHTGARLLSAARNPIVLARPHTGVVPEHLAEFEQAMTWFAVEHPVLLAAIDQLADTGFDTHIWQLASTLTDFLDRRARWHDWASTQRTAVAAARRLADPSAQALTHRSLAGAYHRLGRVDDAHKQLQQALDLSREAGDRLGQAHDYLNLAEVSEQQGHHAEALHQAQQALDLYRAVGYQLGQARALNSIGWFYALLDNHQQALASCQQALTLLQDLGDHAGQADTWDSLGYAHHHLGHHAEAVTCYQHALDLYRDLGDRYNEADTVTHLGDTHHAAGSPQAARESWQHALTIFDQLQHPAADQVRIKLHQLDQPPPLTTPSSDDHASDDTDGA